MHGRQFRIFLIGLVGLVVLTVAGCGSKKSATTTTTATTTTSMTTAATGTTTTTAAAATTASGSTAGLGALSGSCSQFASLGEEFANAMEGSAGDTAKTAAVLKAFADKAPADIKPDFEILATDFQKIAAATQGIKPGQTPDAATLAKLSALSSSLDTAALTKASTDISTWAAKNCHA
jgi:hypothetical protein